RSIQPRLLRCPSSLPSSTIHKRKDAVERSSTASPGNNYRSEQELRSKLQYTRVVGARHLAEVSIGKAQVQSAELRVVKGVVRLDAELHLRPLALGQSKRLEQAEIPVGQPRSPHGISARVAKAVVRATIPWSRGRSERGRI